MPFYALQYHGEFQIKDGDICDIDIYDTTTVSEEPVDTTIISLNDANGKLPEDCVKVIADTKSEDKFKDVIRNKSATIKFFSSTSLTMSTFATGEDKRWLTVITIRGKYTLFTGFINQDNLREPFLDPNINTVTLTAHDGLKDLYNIPLTKPDGTNPRGLNRIIEYLHWCLLKTGQNLLIYSMNNIRPYFTTKQMYQKNWIEGKSWEEEINESISCGDVIEKILGHCAFLSQRNGHWWICNTDEYEADDDHLVTVYLDAVNVSEETHDINKEIGFDENMFFSKEATEVGIIRPHKYVALQYPFEYPRELINNIDFDRGDEKPLIEQTITDGIKFDHDEWTIYRRYPNKGTPISTTATGYILRMYEDGYEKQRYLVLQPGSTSAFPPTHIETTDGTPMHTGDKLSWSFDFKLASNISGTGAVNFPIAHIRLEADDGSIYTMRQSDGVWIASPQYEIINTSWQREAIDESKDWQTISVESKPLPEDGKVYFAMYHARMIPANNYVGDIHFQNMQLIYEPLVNGSYMKYKSQEHRVTQDGNYAANVNEEVYVSDGVKKLFKGALQHRLELSEVELDIWVLSDLFYAGHVYPAGLPGGVDPHPYGHLQAFNVWNQVNRQFRLFEIEVQGLDMATFTAPDLVNKYRINDLTDHSENKYFLLLHFEMDIRSCSWKGIMVEVVDSTIAKVYDDDKTFKYLSER